MMNIQKNKIRPLSQTRDMTPISLKNIRHCLTKRIMVSRLNIYNGLKSQIDAVCIFKQ
ncbi:MAG: hypothetical protein J6568_00835 [Snodgrassella sp.]|nr:hypothetical protein [Snodgrassella sp.]